MSNRSPTCNALLEFGDDELLDLPELKLSIENDKLPRNFDELLASPILTAKLMNTPLGDTPKGQLSDLSTEKNTKTCLFKAIPISSVISVGSIYYRPRLVTIVI